MATAVHIPLSDYLRTSYRPDLEYIDGNLQEKNMGQYEHSYLQSLLAAWFMNHRAVWKAIPLTEQRIRVSATRVRLPDLCLVPFGPQPDIIANPHRGNPLPRRHLRRTSVPLSRLRSDGCQDHLDHRPQDPHRTDRQQSALERNPPTGNPRNPHIHWPRPTFRRPRPRPPSLNNWRNTVILSKTNDPISRSFLTCRLDAPTPIPP